MSNRVTRVRQSSNVSGSSVNPNRYSVFGITINTNYRPTDRADQVETTRQFEDAVAATFGSDASQYGRFLDFLSPTTSHMLDSAETNIRVETGFDPRGRRVHANVEFAVHHRTRIRVNRQKLKNEVMRMIRAQNSNLKDKVKNVYVFIKLLPQTWERNRENYNKKREFEFPE
jgi:hypothetical protein